MPLEVNLMVLVAFAPVLVKGQGQGALALAAMGRKRLRDGEGGRRAGTRVEAEAEMTDIRRSLCGLNWSG